MSVSKYTDLLYKYVNMTRDMGLSLVTREADRKTGKGMGAGGERGNILCCQCCWLSWWSEANEVMLRPRERERERARERERERKRERERGRENAKERNGGTIT